MIYRVPCMDCNSVYIGKTSRCLQKRLTEHKGAVNRCNRKNGIASHDAWDQDHRVDWQEASVIQTESHYWKRRALEAIWIQGNSNSNNLDCGLTLDPIWLPLFDSLLKTITCPLPEHLNYTSFVHTSCTSHHTYVSSHTGD